MLIKLKESEKTIVSPAHTYEILKRFFKKQDIIDRDKEHLFVVHLNVRNKIKSIELVSIGTVSSALIHPREVFTRVIANRASGMILVHNHPSGETEPSDEDRYITFRIKECAHLLGIDFTDHIIITADSYYSFKEHAIL